MAILSGDDRRRLVPQALVSVLTVLIDELEDERPSPTWAELRALRSRLCRLYRISDPAAAANESDVAQALAEIDGLPVED